MPRAIVVPDVNPATEIRKVPTQQRIPNFRSLLCFFDEFMTLSEDLRSNPIVIGSGMRSLIDGPEIKYLIEKGVAFQSVCPPTKLIGDAAVKAQESFSVGEMYDVDLKQKSEFVGEAEVMLPRRIAAAYDKKHPCLTIDFLEGISVPREDIPYDHILTFKEKRNPELQAFWQAMYTISSQVEWMRSNDPEREFRERIVKELETYNRIASETWGSRVRSNLSLTFVLDRNSGLFFGASGATGVFGVHFMNQDPLVLGGVTAVMGLMGVVRAKVDLLPAKEPFPQGSRAMSYLSRTNKL